MSTRWDHRQNLLKVKVKTITLFTKNIFQINAVFFFFYFSLMTKLRKTQATQFKYISELCHYRNKKYFKIQFKSSFLYYYIAIFQCFQYY